jgi:RND family efflux transporter MFP subunit
MRSSRRKVVLAIVVIAMAAWFGRAAYDRLQERTGPGKGGPGKMAVPVEVAEVQHGPIVLLRTFSGTLEALARFVVAPKVSGRVERLYVDISDTVKRGQVVAELDSDEYVQAVAQAEADLAVARANLVEAGSALEIAARELERVRTLRKRGVASDSQFDEVRAGQLSKQAGFEVAKAQVTREEASLETAKIRLGYTKVPADWGGPDDERVVAECYVEEGDTVSENAPLLSIVELDPLIGVIFVPEKDYARLQAGQSAYLTTDAFPGERFEGRIDRIAPVFQEATRQARIELRIENPEHRLKPGMFIRATIELEREPDATIVPEKALTERDDRTGVFVVRDDGRRVRWQEIEVGIRQHDRVQVKGSDLSGRVVTLGQQLIDDGSDITIHEEDAAAFSGHEGADPE